MNLTQLIAEINKSNHPPLLKAQLIGIIREIHVQPQIPIDDLLVYCAKAVGTTVAAAKSKNKLRINVRARMLFVFYIFKHRYGMLSLNDIASYIGGRDHTTVIHNREKAYDLEQAKDEMFMIDLDNLYTLIAGGKLPEGPTAKASPKRRNIWFYYDRKTGIYYRTLRDIGQHLRIRVSPDSMRRFGNRFEKISEEVW